MLGRNFDDLFSNKKNHLKKQNNSRDCNLCHTSQKYEKNVPCEALWNPSQYLYIYTCKVYDGCLVYLNLVNIYIFSKYMMDDRYI